MTELEKILAGDTCINDYNIDLDFDNDEIDELLRHDIINAANIGMMRASDLLIDGIISYDQYPFEKFSAYEQIRQLQYGVIVPEDFRKKADFDSFDSDDWLYLLDVIPQFKESAPWEILRQTGSVKGWTELLGSRPEFAEYADWGSLAKKGTAENFFDMLNSAPVLYKYFTNKEQLQAADSLLWVKLLARRPELAEIYPLADLDETDEIEFLLLHQPQLVNQISWDKENPPVKLYITNPSPEILPEIRLKWFITAKISNNLQSILKKILFYDPDDARRHANIIGHSEETFSGIYSQQTAQHIMQEFQKAVAEKQLDLQIRMEKINNGN